MDCHNYVSPLLATLSRPGSDAKVVWLTVFSTRTHVPSRAARRCHVPEACVVVKKEGRSTERDTRSRRISSDKETPMLKWLFKRQLDAFDREYGYDSSYVREILSADLDAAIKFSKVMGLARYRKRVPADVRCAAGLVGTMAEDCGPCTQ